MKGSDFLKQMANVTDPQRDLLALKALIAGNIPGWWFDLVECATEAVIDNVYYRCAYRTPPQLLPIGDDTDWVLWPLNETSAQAYCDSQILSSSSDGSTSTKFFIPPAKIVKATWEQSRCKILPQTISRVTASNKTGHPGLATEVIGTEQQMINEAMRDAGCPLNAFCRPKKVYITRPNLDGTRQAFGGWFYPGGQNLLLAGDPFYHPDPRRVSGGRYGSQIQPWDWSFHEAAYEDYSQGVDLVYYAVRVNGEPYTFDEVCSHPKLWPLVSDDGPFNPRYPNVGRGAKPLLNHTTRMPSEGSAPPAPANVKSIARYASDASGTARLVQAGTSSPPAGPVSVAGDEPWLPPWARNALIVTAAGGLGLVVAHAVSR